MATSWIDFLHKKRILFYEEHRPSPHSLWAETWRGHMPVNGHLHRHPGFELGVVLEGREEISYCDFIAVCHPGDVWFCSSLEPHQFHIPMPKTRTDVFIFQREFLGEELLSRGMPWIAPFVVAPSERPRVNSLETRQRVLLGGEILRRELLNKRPDWQSVVRHEILSLLIELVREWTPHEEVDCRAEVSSRQLATVLPALKLVREKSPESVSVGEAASACGLSPSWFQVVFRRTVGSNFGEYSTRVRLSYAAYQILHSNRTFVAIARESGFVDDSHMRRHFVTYYNCTPTEYRARQHAAKH